MFRWWNDLAGSADVCLTGSGLSLLPSSGDGARGPLHPVASAMTDEALEQALGELSPELGRRRSLRVWLGASLLYQATVAAEADALSRRDRLALLSAHWHATLGEESGPLAVTYAVQRGGHSVVTSCIPVTLIDALRTASQACGLRLRKVAPFSARVWDTHRRTLRDSAGCLVVWQDDVVSIGAFDEGRWTAWAGEGWSGGSWPDLARRVRRFIRCHGLPEDLPVWVHADTPVAGDRTLAGLDRWTLLAAPRGLEAQA